jgi:hypothetical protein
VETWPVYESPLLQALWGLSLGLGLPLGFVAAFLKYEKSLQRKRTVVSIVALVAVVLTPLLVNVQTEVAIDQDHVSIRHLIVGGVSIPKDEITVLREVTWRSGTTLVLDTLNGRSYGVNVRGNLLDRMAGGLAEHLNLTAVPEEGSRKWVRN